ncbi:MAG: hypothetical protein F6K26_43370 [Moorea sp. SIO2I5]|nr:hypothetical protein [Moorena sp. SIO2I5]
MFPVPCSLFPFLYALAHREDQEPLRVLYSRRSPDQEATWYGPMTTPEGETIEANISIATEAIRQRFEAIKQQKGNNNGVAESSNE